MSAKKSPVVLTSTPMIHAPGIIRWARQLGQKTFDPEMGNQLTIIGFLVYTFPQMTGEVALSIFKGDYTVDNDKVIIELEES